MIEVVKLRNCVMYFDPCRHIRTRKAWQLVLHAYRAQMFGYFDGICTHVLGSK